MQYANGGAGGASTGGTAGVGGAATSNLTFDDTASVHQSAAVESLVAAGGGAGGAGHGGSSAAAGGAASATLTLTGSNTVLGETEAQGGSSGAPDSPGAYAAGAAATATTTLHAGGAVSGFAYAIGGSGATAGAATATISAIGTSGSVSAEALTSTSPGHLVESVMGYSTVVVEGSAKAYSQATIGGTPATYVTAYQGVAIETGAPNAASTSAVLSANPIIATAFGSSPVFFAIGELGGAHSTVGTDSQVITSNISFTVDLTQLAVRQDLVVGFYHPTTLGAGVTSMTLDIYVNGTDTLNVNFVSAADATTFFTDNAFDLGSLASGDTVNVEARLSITTASPGGGFDGAFIFGDPPPAEHVVVASHAALASAAPASAAITAVHPVELSDTAHHLSLPTHELHPHTVFL